MTSDPAFAEQHKKKGAPLAMIAFATSVMNRVSKSKGNFEHHFDGLTITVPPCRAPSIIPSLDRSYC